MSAAGHARKNNLDVLVIEKGEVANTVFNYQKRKHVMAEPSILPLRSDLPFRAGTREAVLESWNSVVTEIGMDIRRPEEVKEIAKVKGTFTVRTDKGDYQSKYVILAIGIQGDLRKLDVPGETLPHVSAHLADPVDYEDKYILMVGAGDAAVEGVLALCEKNRVTVINRNSEFYRLKKVLDLDINRKVSAGLVNAYHNARVERIDEGYTYLKLPDREAKAKADLVFVRIGAEIPRSFLEESGVLLSSNAPHALPVLNEHFETSTPGLFLIGAAAGYNLIKQGMNQGYDVVEYMLGHHIKAVDEPILRDKLKDLPGTTQECFSHILSTIPMLTGVSKQALSELILESTVHRVQPGTVLFKEHDFTDSLYMILEGSAQVTLSCQTKEDKPLILSQGEFFGEMSLLSGRRRSATVKAVEPSLFIEAPRKAVLRLLNAEPSAKRAMDDTFIVRAIQNHLLPAADLGFLRELASKATVCNFKNNEVVFREGDIGDAFYLIRSGSVKVSKRVPLSDKEIVANYVPAGRYFGEMALLDPTSPTRAATVTATKHTEVIKLRKEDFDLLLNRYPDFEKRLRQNFQKTLIRGQEVALREVTGGEIIDGMMKEGVFEGTDVLLIDANKCVRCDQCVQACAQTHEGQTRLYRTGGLSFANLQVPTSCRHCENPLCLTDCLAGDAISRDPKGEVFIKDNCIGCGNCAKNCPYGNILMMHGEKPTGAWNGLLSLIGIGTSKTEEEATKAVKCDLCRGDDLGPACVRSCPTGAAIRVSPEEYFKQVGVGAL